MPAWLAFAVVRLLEDHFTALVDYDFTAELEEILDTIAGGEQSRNVVLGAFYYGGADPRGGRFVGLPPLMPKGFTWIPHRISGVIGARLFSALL